MNKKRLIWQRAFGNFIIHARQRVNLGQKLKTMIALAIAINGRYPHCTGFRIKKAMASGFSKEKISEGVMEVALVSSGIKRF